jgi:hypothetical protein
MSSAKAAVFQTRVNFCIPNLFQPPRGFDVVDRHVDAEVAIAASPLRPVGLLRKEQNEKQEKVCHEIEFEFGGVLDSSRNPKLTVPMRAPASPRTGLLFRSSSFE